MKFRKFAITALLLVLVISTVPIASHASSSPSVKMGTFEPNPDVSNFGGNSSKIGQWVSMSWGINSAYQVGAVNYQYQFLFGNFYQNGQQVVQDVYVNIHLNWTAIGSDGDFGPMGTSLGAPYWGWLNEYQYQFAVGDGMGNGKPLKLVLVQGNTTVLATNVTEGVRQQPSTVSLPDPNPIQNGSFYIILFAAMYYPQTIYAGSSSNQFVAYEPVYIGEGEFNALNSHVSGKPTTSVNAGLLGASALLNWSFSAGEWEVTFVHYLNNNPSDNSSTNIQVLQYYNFTYKSTGGIAHLRYNFSLNQASGVYAWRFLTSVNDVSYGSSFIVYNNVSVQQSGDKPPMISIYIKPARQGGNEQISVYAKDAKNSSIFLEISVWYGNDIYTIPDPNFSNVLYYFAPANVSSGANYSLPAFTNDFYGELNVEVLSENIYHEWNNSYASSVVRSNVYQNGSFSWGSAPKQWFASPLSSPLNAIFLVAGVGVFIYSVHESGIEVEVRRRVMEGLGAAGFLADARTHYLAAVFLIIIAFVNWSLVFATITSWGGMIP